MMSVEIETIVRTIFFFLLSVVPVAYSVRYFPGRNYESSVPIHLNKLTRYSFPY